MIDEKKKPIIDKCKCTGCGICVYECPNNALKIVSDIAEHIDPENCNGCGECENVCPNEAIKMQQ